MRLAYGVFIFIAVGISPMLWSAQALSSPRHAAAVFCLSQNQVSAAQTLKPLLARATETLLRHAEQQDTDITRSTPDM